MPWRGWPQLPTTSQFSSATSGHGTSLMLKWLWTVTPKRSRNCFASAVSGTHFTRLSVVVRSPGDGGCLSREGHHHAQDAGDRAAGAVDALPEGGVSKPEKTAIEPPSLSIASGGHQAARVEHGQAGGDAVVRPGIQAAVAVRHRQPRHRVQVQVGRQHRLAGPVVPEV
jgi:hypothetical protein